MTYFFIRTVAGNNGGGNVPWTINQSTLSNGTNANVSDVHTFNSNTANQAWLTFTRAAGGRVNLPQFGPATQTLATYGFELPDPGTQRAAQFRSVRGHLPRARRTPVRSRVLTTLSYATWSR